MNWRKYNQSQTKEKTLFLTLLGELCSTIPSPPYTFGRPTLPLKDKLFLICLKTYYGKSTRRTMGEIELCKRAGYLTKNVTFNTVLKYFKDPDLTPVLHQLIQASSAPLTDIEKHFAADSTGFSLRMYDERWSSVRGKHSKHRRYLKCHAMFGVATNVCTAAHITPGTAHDSPHFKPLFDQTNKHFTMLEVSADKAYSSRNNLSHAFNHKCIPFIPFKKNTTPHKKGASPIWRQMWRFFHYNQKQFLQRYHQRSNAETAFWMIKQKYGNFLWTKTPTSQTNELLTKLLCHNLTVLIQETFLLGIHLNLTKNNPTKNAKPGLQPDLSELLT